MCTYTVYILILVKEQGSYTLFLTKHNSNTFCQCQKVNHLKEQLKTHSVHGIIIVEQILFGLKEITVTVMEL